MLDRVPLRFPVARPEAAPGTAESGPEAFGGVVG
jgi:hypothetical protein